MLPGLLQCVAHSTRASQKLQKVVCGIVPLLLGNVGDSRGSRRGSRLSNLLHTAIIASSKLLVHLQDPISELTQLLFAHIAMFLSKHALQQFPSLADTDRHTSSSKHLLPAVPD